MVEKTNIIDLNPDSREAGIEAYKECKNLTPDSEWNIVQTIAQEIESTYVVAQEKKPASPALREQLIKVIEERYKDDPETKEIVLRAVPSVRAIHAWREKNGWEDAVWKQIRDTGLFSREKRADIINGLFREAKEGNTQAAKLWLTMSGDYSEKVDMKTDETVEKFREINNILFKKNK